MLPGNADVSSALSAQREQTYSPLPLESEADGCVTEPGAVATGCEHSSCGILRKLNLASPRYRSGFRISRPLHGLIGLIWL